MAAPIRLQKLLADHGIASRRKAEELILTGKVRVNGAVVQQLGTRVDPESDAVEVAGRRLRVAPPLRHLLVHKPVGYVSTCDDPRGRRTVLELLPASWRSGQGLHPVGRLDYDSSGALLVSNDGEFTFRVTHPRHHLPKTYEVWVSGHPTETTLNRWRSGILLEGRPTLPATVRRRTESPTATLLEIVLIEGRNRQIRKVAELLGHPVQRLHRTAVGPVQLGELPPGGHRHLHRFEIEQLQASGTPEP